MAVIGSIRKRSGLLIILIGMAILLFVLGDALGSGGLFSPSVPQVGSINGESVDATQLEQEAAKLEQLYTSYGSTITRDQARKQAWANLVRDKVFYACVQESGVNVTDDEYDDIRWGDAVMDEFTNAPRYKGANGLFSPDSVQIFYTALWENRREIYKAEKKRLVESKLTEKFNTLIGKSIYYNNIDGKDNANGTSEKVSFQYVMKKYAEIPDSTITPDESLMTAYFNDHKNDKSFEQVEARSIEYVTFGVVPTEGDKVLIMEEVANLKEGFQTSTNDSSYVIANSDLSSYIETTYKQGSRQDNFDSELTNASIGSIVGPYKDGESYKIAKVVRKSEPQDESRVRHILLKSATDNDDLKNRADSILRAIKKDGDAFDALGAKFSEDNFQGNQGVYDWFPKGQMVTEFEDFSFDNAEGSKGVVKTQFGYHIIEVLGRRNAISSIIAEISRNIVASTETVNLAYEEASNFAVDYNSEDKFSAGALEKGLQVDSEPNLKMAATSVGKVTDAREIVRWAYDDSRTVGEISQAFDLNENFVVAKFVAKKEKGVPTYENAKELVKTEVLKQMKADKIIASFSGAGDLNAIATSLDVKVNDANDIAYSVNGAPGAGNEPLMIGKAFALPEGGMSEPIKGNQGVFVIKVLSKVSGSGDVTDYTNNQNNLMKQAETSVVSRIQGAMNTAADVENTIDKLY
ncbi:MAG: peptidyl-prolyl cis-trans isomerase D [Patiriisocius sp.]|jgi:peptidyl-prolyl cis-trans isomerase D